MTEKEIQIFADEFEEKLRKGIFPNIQVVDCSIIVELACELIPVKEETDEDNQN